MFGSGQNPVWCQTWLPFSDFFLTIYGFSAGSSLLESWVFPRQSWRQHAEGGSQVEREPVHSEPQECMGSLESGPSLFLDLPWLFLRAPGAGYSSL